MSMQQDFINTFGPLIVEACDIYGYGYPSAIIAQAALESGWGRSELAREHHNYFGMKAGSSWDGASVDYTSGEYGGAYYKVSTFRSYSSMSEGIKGYFDFLKYPRYSNLQRATGWEDYLDKIAADGWATNPAYAEKVKAIVKQYDLASWDLKETEPESQMDDPLSCIGKKAVTKWPMKIRKHPTTNSQQIGRVPEGGDFIITDVAQMLNGELWAYSTEVKGWVGWDVDGEIHLVID